MVQQSNRADAGASAAVDQSETEAHAEIVADPKLLEILVCPVTKCSLSYDRERQELVSRAARLAFPIRNGIPNLTVDGARSLDE